MSRFWGALVPLVALVFGGASSADALDLCVAPVGSNPPGCEDGVYATFAAALDAAAVVQDPLLSLRLATNQTHIESVVIRQTELGFDELNLGFGGGVLCPDPGSPADQAVVEIEGDGVITVDQILIDLSAATGACAARRPGILLEGAGEFFLTFPRVLGTLGAAVEVRRATPSDGQLLVDRGEFLGGEGPALDVQGFANVRTITVAGFVLDAAAPGRGLLASDGGGGLSLRDSLVFGNLVSADGGAEGLVAGPFGSIENSLFVANAMDGVPLVASDPGARIVYPGPGGLAVAEPHVLDCVFARNRRVRDADRALLGPVLRLDPVDPFVGACPGDLLGGSLLDRPSPILDLPQDSGGLLEFGFGDLEAGAELRDVRLFNNVFVDNQLGEAPSVRVDATRSPTSLQCIHNTFGPGGEGARIELLDGAPGSDLVLARNLLSVPLSEAVFVGGQGLSTAVISMNLGPEGTVWASGLASVPNLIVGPSRELVAGGFRPAAEVADADACTRSALSCPEVDIGRCAAQREAGELYSCLGDLAASLIPTAASEELWAAPWPWATGFFGPAPPGADVPGATGWSCGERRGGYDRIGVGNSFTGDGDGWPDLVDCDNDDPEQVPNLPGSTGYDGVECVPVQGDCYLCPGQSQDLGPPGDGSGSPTGELVPVGCGSRGCGVAIDCGGGASVALLGLVWLVPARRRRAR